MYNHETDKDLHPAHQQALAILDGDPLKNHSQLMRIYARYVVSSEVVKVYKNGLRLVAHKDKDGVVIYDEVLPPDKGE